MYTCRAQFDNPARSACCAVPCMHVGFPRPPRLLPQSPTHSSNSGRAGPRRADLVPGSRLNIFSPTSPPEQVLHRLKYLHLFAYYKRGSSLHSVWWICRMNTTHHPYSSYIFFNWRAWMTDVFFRIYRKCKPNIANSYCYKCVDY